MVLSYSPCSLAWLGVAFVRFLPGSGGAFGFLWPSAVLFGLAVCLPPCVFLCLFLSLFGLPAFWLALPFVCVHVYAHTRNRIRDGECAAIERCERCLYSAFSVCPRPAPRSDSHAPAVDCAQRRRLGWGRRQVGQVDSWPNQCSMHGAQKRWPQARVSSWRSGGIVAISSRQTGHLASIGARSWGTGGCGEE